MLPVGKNIKAIRKFKSITQSDLAKKIKISNTYLSLIENGKKNPSLEMVFSISEALEVDPASIVTKDESFIKLQEILKENDFSETLTELSTIMGRLKSM